MSNLLGAGVDRGADDLAALRDDQRRRREAGEEVHPGKEAPKDDGSEDDPEETPDEEEESKAKKKKKKKDKGKKKKNKFKVVGTKELSKLFKDTGLDPAPKTRRRFKRRAAKVARAKKDQAEGGSSDSSGSSSSEEIEDDTMFGGGSKIVSIGRRFPGTLAATAIEEAAEGLVTLEGGVWNTTTGALPALFGRYHRLHLQGRMTPAMSRQCHTLTQILDSLMRGEAARACDLAAQRVKALEMMAQGSHFSVAQQLELVGKETLTMSTTAEYQDAARRAREEGKAKAESARPYGSRGYGGGRNEEGQKGSGKKGGGKGKGNKGDGKKNDGNKGDAGKPKGGWITWKGWQREKKVL